MSRSRSICIGVVADTHGRFDPAIPRHFQNVDHIMHAGDIGMHTVIDHLKAIAPVTAVSGNIDGYEKSGFPPETIFELSGYGIAVRHILYERGKLTNTGQVFLNRVQPDVCIFRPHPPTYERMARQHAALQPRFSGTEAVYIAQDVGSDHNRRTDVGETRSIERTDYMSFDF